MRYNGLIAILVELKSRYLLASKLKSKYAEETKGAFFDI